MTFLTLAVHLVRKCVAMDPGRPVAGPSKHAVQRLRWHSCGRRRPRTRRCGTFLPSRCPPLSGPGASRSVHQDTRCRGERGYPYQRPVHVAASACPVSAWRNAPVPHGWAQSPTEDGGEPKRGKLSRATDPQRSTKALSDARQARMISMRCWTSELLGHLIS